MPPGAANPRLRSRTPPTRGFWDRRRERKEKARELLEQDAMYSNDPKVLDWWVSWRETAAMEAQDDYHLLHWYVRFMD